MRRDQRQKILFYVILGLIAVGILSSLFRNPGGMLIPIIVLGGVFLLYKFPPHRWKSFSFRAKPRYAPPSPKEKGRKTQRAKFRVIQGSKRDDDNDNVPKYH
ncbi:hypothetical protein [Paenibacillus sp.]|uniref:hypothetical protein n=1 Tax=Paenibacillus sp. TaxID=58172 RepID=UPI002D5159CE|nr:hypothetical protein [Paenibacillus sp.]HZG85103.1 hypothetical protein [Paenibacillus sp.]